MSGSCGWIVPDWPAPACVRAVFTTRAGPTPERGASVPPWSRFNLGDHVGDDPAAVTSNRSALREVLLARPVFLQQVHGTNVAHLDLESPDGTVADAAVTSRPGLACTIMVADCLPVLLTDAAGRAIGAAHAGWRGLAGGVLEQTLTAFCDLSRTQAHEVMAWFGPCIGPGAFEVGAEVREAFLAADEGADVCFQALNGGKYLADLPGLARRRLKAVGVSAIYGNDSSSTWCTVSQPSQFFSHRRDQGTLGTTGRMAACIWLAP
ncbi:peptidoglycan editing factor PgeF [Ottowia caeni]|uniref:peptidoglycan editing factor PgeF n=1 Tax=Ottowia caeni TaxID=2870339 RepID=UPI001E5932E2|nr:peptidoglycan editing factor PgeF [Ottowia caeni]